MAPAELCSALGPNRDALSTLVELTVREDVGEFKTIARDVIVRPEHRHAPEDDANDGNGKRRRLLLRRLVETFALYLFFHSILR